MDDSAGYYTTLQSPTKAEADGLQEVRHVQVHPGLHEPAGPIDSLHDYRQQVPGVPARASRPRCSPNQTRSQIAAGLTDATSPVTDGDHRHGELPDRGDLLLTNNHPGNVCTSKGVMAAKKAMKNQVSRSSAARPALGEAIDVPALSLIGLALSAYLTITHFDGTRLALLRRPASSTARR